MNGKNGGRDGIIMKKKLTGNLPLKILSVIVAFLFWLVIINVTDPTTARTFYGIPVQVLNENVITSANQVYEIVDGDKVNVTVKGKRSFVETLGTSDFVATADMSELSKVNAVSIDVKLE
jgi:YbbR domain-containing protein